MEDVQPDMVTDVKTDMEMNMLTDMKTVWKRRYYCYIC